jgi:hypothetical protein
MPAICALAHIRGIIIAQRTNRASKILHDFNRRWRFARWHVNC